MAPITDWIRDVDEDADVLDEVVVTAEAGVSPAAFPDPVADGGPSRRRRWALLLIAVICVAGAGFTAWTTVLRPSVTRAPAVTRATSTSTSTSDSTATSTSGFVTYVDATKHYRISYPAAWQRTSDTQGELSLQVSGRDAVSVSAFTLAAIVNTQNVADMRAVTDAVLSAPSAHLTVLASQVVKVGQLTGLYYLYYFPSGAEQGVHAHYFLFSGKQMYTLVFQALPAADFGPLAKTFDAVAGTFAVTTPR